VTRQRRRVHGDRDLQSGERREAGNGVRGGARPGAQGRVHRRRTEQGASGMAAAEPADARQRRRAGGEVHGAVHHGPHDGVRGGVREDGAGADGRGRERGGEKVHQAGEDHGGGSGGLREASAESCSKTVTVFAAATREGTNSEERRVRGTNSEERRVRGTNSEERRGRGTNSEERQVRETNSEERREELLAPRCRFRRPSLLVPLTRRPSPTLLSLLLLRLDDIRLEQPHPDRKS